MADAQTIDLTTLDPKTIKIIAPAPPIDLDKYNPNDIKIISPPSNQPPESYNSRALKSLATTAGKAIEAVDSVTGAPIRSAIGKLQEGGGLLDAAKAAGNQFAQNPANAPTGKDIAAKAGFSTNEDLDTGLHLSPIGGSSVKVSPAGMAGTVIDSLADPLTYVGGKPFELFGKTALETGAKLAGGAAEKLAGSAETSAIKAITHHNLSALEKLPDNAGRNLLDEGTIGWIDKVKTIAPKLDEAKQKYGELIGKIGDEIDNFQPHAVSNEAIANQITDYAKSIPQVGKGAQLRDRLMQEAQNIQSLGPLNFKDAQEVKGQFQYKPLDNDPLFSNQGVTNKLNQIISGEMNNTADFYSRNPVKGMDAHLLNQYDIAKDKYATFKNAADAAEQRIERDKNINFLSPSSKGLGGTAFMGELYRSHDPMSAAVVGGLAAVGNKIVQDRGSAFAANSLDVMAKALAVSSDLMQKYGPQVLETLNKGPNAVAVMHHFLINTDPEYKAVILSQQPSAMDRKLQQMQPAQGVQ